MAKLTKRQRVAVDRALYHANRASRYLHAERIAICHRDTMATTTLHYQRADGTGGALYEVAKDIGSDLVGLADAIRELERLYQEG